MRIPADITARKAAILADRAAGKSTAADRVDKPAEREDATIGNEQLLRGLPLFQQSHTEDGKIGMRGNRGSGFSGAIAGTKPGSPAKYVHQTETSIPMKRGER